MTPDEPKTHLSEVNLEEHILDCRPINIYGLGLATLACLRHIHILNKMMSQIENMTTQQVGINRAIDLLEEKSRSYDELVVINVIRESFFEVANEESVRKVA